MKTIGWLKYAEQIPSPQHSSLNGNKMNSKNHYNRLLIFLAITVRRKMVYIIRGLSSTISESRQIPAETSNPQNLMTTNQ